MGLGPVREQIQPATQLVGASVLTHPIPKGRARPFPAQLTEGGSRQDPPGQTAGHRMKSFLEPEAHMWEAQGCNFPVSWANIVGILGK